jgi:imidazole glycerol-phosphate synthase subunit HisH
VTQGAVPGRRVGVVDYQAGNLHSIGNAFEHLGAQVVRVHQASQVDGCSHLVLPGVGAFGFCAERLAESGLMGAVERWAFELQRPLLGICVGMQLLADGSDESPDAPGLGWIGGRVGLIPGVDRVVRVPHVGWNTVTFESSWGEYRAGDEADFYFDHSFAYANPIRGSTVASCEHGVRFSAVVERNNVIAAQFHPEKSQAAGMRFLRGFLAA